MNNRVAEGQADGSSLFLVQVQAVRLRVGRKASEYPDSKRAVRAAFRYRRVDYLMDVTDPGIEREFLSQPDGDYEIRNSYLYISLGDPYQGYFYKLVAAILYQERFA